MLREHKTHENNFQVFSIVKKKINYLGLGNVNNILQKSKFSQTIIFDLYKFNKVCIIITYFKDMKIFILINDCLLQSNAGIQGFKPQNP